MKLLYSKKHCVSALKCISLCVILLFVFSAAGAAHAAEPTQTIRIGYPIQSGLTDCKDGVYSGYTYDYLREIAQYVDFNLEFVFGEGETLNDSLINVFDMLETGEIDVMGTVYKSDAIAELYDFTNSYGTVYTTLSVRMDDADYDTIDSQVNQTLTVATSGGPTSARRIALDDYCTSNNVDYTVIECATAAQAMQLVLDGKATALLNSSINYDSTLRTIARFAPLPFYFAVTKGNTRLVQQLNTGIYNIEKNSPYFATTLMQKYFGEMNHELVLSTADKNYIAHAQTIRVGIDTQSPPFQYLDPRTGALRGIGPDILQYIAQQTNLQFEYVMVDTRAQLIEMLQSHEIDMASNISGDYDLAQQNNISLSRSYLSAPYFMMIHEGIDSKNLSDRALALPDWQDVIRVPSENIRKYPTEEACIVAVNTGVTDYAVINSYAAQYYINQMSLSNTYLVQYNTMTAQSCFGLAKPVDLELLSIINKTLVSLPEETMQSMVYQNILMPSKLTFRDFLEANPEEALITLSAILLFVIGALTFGLHSRIAINRQIASELQKHQSIYSMANERFFDYDCLKSTLLVSDPRDESKRVTLISLLSPPHAGFDWRFFCNFLDNRADGMDEFDLPCLGGEPVWVRIASKRIAGHDGKIVSIIGKILDIDEEKQKLDELEELASLDSLTHVYNNRATWLFVGEQITKLSTETHGALIILDIDRFKQINDTYGHLNGDITLIALSKMLQNAIGGTGVVGRLGGDEFLIYLPHVSNHAQLAAVSCDLCTRAHSILVDGSQPLTISVGSTLSSQRDSVDQLYERADCALYEAKRKGRDGYFVA